MRNLNIRHSSSINQGLVDKRRAGRLSPFSLHLATPLVLALAALSLGCSDSSDDQLPASGVWDVRFNLTTDECGLVAGDIPGFVDQHQIAEAGDMLSLSAVSGIFADSPGQRSSNTSFTIEDEIEGDLFGTGVPCLLTASVTYNLKDQNSADTLFVQEINCTDGLSCRSNGPGSAKRQPDF